MKNLKKLFFLLFILSAKLYCGQSSYFQQKVDSYINVSLDDKNHFLNGDIKVIYTNNSNTNLDSIIFHVWPNAYKNIDTELGKQKIEDGQLYIKYAPNYTRGYMDSLKFKVDGESVPWKLDDQYIDIAILHLNTSLKQGESIEITTPFRVKIPSGRFSRLGHIGQSYQITQWFPKPAVYDEDGWHPMPYLNQGEFYSEYGKYDVSITLPENYVLMATGDLQNQEEIEFLNEKVKLTEKLIAENKLPVKDSMGKANMVFPKSSEKLKTVRFKQENVHDFAWFADKRYHVLKGEVQLPSSEKTVETWALFTNNEAKLWTNAIEYLNDATYYFSKWVGEYPYSHVTAVDGTISAGGGMEYPNITVIGSSGNKYGLETVIVHEVGHNWYYGILGSNERDNAWMDEGLNTYIEIRYFEEKYGNKNILNLSTGRNKINLDIQHKDVHRVSYQFNASRNYDQPMQMGSPKFTSMNYGGIVYSKTGIGFHYLKDYLGEELFDDCMQTYFDKWKFRHPKPKDIAEVFSLNSNKNLSWFFDDFINTTDKVDYSIKSIKKIDETQYLIKLKNNRGIPGPTNIVHLTKGKNDTLNAFDQTWIDGFKKDTSLIIKSKNSPTHFGLDFHLNTTDFNFQNHLYRTSGIAKNIKPISFKMIPYSIKSNTKNQIHFTPTNGWNYHDKFMIGTALYNTGIKEKKNEWVLNPMYAFGSKSIIGSGSFTKNINTNSFFPRISLGYKVQSYHSKFEQIPNLDRWVKQELSSNFRIKSKSLRSSPNQSIKFRALKIDQYIPSGLSIYPQTTEQTTRYYGTVDYLISNKQFLKPKNLRLRYVYGAGESNALVSNIQLTSNIKYIYNKRSNAISVRFFGGYQFLQPINNDFCFYLRGIQGSTDYLYDYIFLGRHINSYNNILSQQNSNSYGGFKVNTTAGRSDDWLLSSNILVDLPKLPLSLFIDLGYYDEPTLNASTNTWKNEHILSYNIGLKYDAFIKINNQPLLEIFIPLTFSENIANSRDFINQTPVSELSFLQRINFIFNLNSINPLLIKKELNP